MIEYAPCGCKTTPLTQFDEIESKFKQGKVIWFEDMRAPSSSLRELSKGSKGFMIYDERIKERRAPVYSRLQTPKDDDMIRIAEFPLKWSVDQLKIFFDLGFEFSYSEAKVNRDGKDITMVCIENCAS